MTNSGTEEFNNKIKVKNEVLMGSGTLIAPHVEAYFACPN